MAYLAPKTDWTSVDGVLSTDLNRIEGNIETLATLRAYPTATGTGTAIVVTTGYFELVAGRSFTFIASANNSGAATTINADGTGAKNLYKPNTTAAPTIISGKAYTVWYNGTSFFVKASAEGDAVAGDVLDGKIFSNDEDTGITGTLELTGNAAVGDVLATKTFYKDDAKTKLTGTLALTGDSAVGDVLSGKTFYKDNAKTKLTGTMTNNGTVSTDISAKATEVTIAQGYHSGSGKVKISATEQAKIITGNIKAGITVLGVAGKSSVVDTADANATAGDILNGKTGYVNGSKITGNFPILAGSTVSAGYCYVAYSTAPASTNSTSYVKLKEIQVKKAGTYKVYYEIQGGVAGYQAYGIIYKNGTAYGSEVYYGDSAWHYVIEDLAFAVNDYVQLYVRSTNGTMSATVRNFMVGISPASAQTYIAETII